MTTPIDPISRMSRDIAAASKVLGDDEARFLVDTYYQIQHQRITTHNQIRSIEQGADAGATHTLLDWLSVQFETLEQQIQRSMNIYTKAHPVGTWMRSVYGIGPVIAAGILANIKIEKAPTVGHIWRYAGFDPTVKWEKGQKRPWNAALKTLCWHAGQSFMKFHKRDECYYGKVYAVRKAYEIERNESGGNAALAATLVTRFRDDTKAIEHLKAGRLPPAQIDARARRYAVKLFLSHLHGEWYRARFGKEPPLPYPIAIGKHAHMIHAPAAIQDAETADREPEEVEA